MAVLGLESSQDLKPRSIPVADVKLVSSIRVREHNEHTTKDVYSKIFGADLIESNRRKYEQLKRGGTRDARQANTKATGQTSRILPKFFVAPDGENHPTLTLLGNAVILTPEALLQPTVITDRGQFAGIGTGNTLGGDLEGSTSENNAWEPISNPEAWIETGGRNSNDRKIKRVTDDNLWETIFAEFVLEPNQPFGLSYTLHKAFDSAAMKAAFDREWGTGGEPRSNTFVQFYPKRLREKSAFELYLGARTVTGEGHFIVLVFYSNGQFAAFINDSQGGSTEDVWAPLGTYSLPKGAATSAAEGRQVNVSFYPLGNNLYVYHSINPATKDTKEGKFSTISLPEPIRIAESSPVIISYQGSMEFQFRPIIHKESGELRSPVIQTNFVPVRELLNIAHVGKVGVGASPSEVTFPDPNDGKDDKKPIYDYLKNTRIRHFIEDETAREGSHAVAYRLRLEHAAGDENERVHSPAIFQCQYQGIPGLTTVGLNPTPQIDNDDVLQISITDHAEGSSAVVVLNNRKPAAEARQTLPSFGNYTFRSGVNNFTGVKPIRISIGYDGEDPPGLVQHFRGFVVKRTYGRDGPARSSVTLQCEDRSKQLKESYAVNLPIYDGWCHLGVIHHLAREAGFADDEILLSEDPLTGDKTTIASVLVGDPDSRNRGCFAGHVDGFPGQGIGGGLPGTFVHQTLPMVPLHEAPNYMFQMGTPLWDCMQQVRQHSQWYLFCNSNGNLIYAPPKLMVQNRSKVFREVDIVQAFDEFQRNLTAEHDTAEQRNSVIVWGLVPSEDGRGNPTWTPDVHVRRQSGWPNNIGEPSYYPWLRWLLFRNPKLNDHNRNRAIASEMFKRVTRERIASTFGAWGQPEMFPYELIVLNEEQAGETGVDGKTFIVSSVTHALNADGFTYDCDVVAELFDETKFTFDPYI